MIQFWIYSIQQFNKRKKEKKIGFSPLTQRVVLFLILANVFNFFCNIFQRTMEK